VSICTKTGDSGTTGLMYNRRVSKTNPRIEACGSLDELNSALGLARAHSTQQYVSAKILKVQKDLITIMGEIATLEEDLPRYEIDGFQLVSQTHYSDLETWIKEIEAQKISFHGWATPGETLSAAALDMARSVCRRAERRVSDLIEQGQIHNQHILIYLNRASDLIWLLARREETINTPAPPRD
jgi:cob(I)alamin adenosyltransferase